MRAKDPLIQLNQSRRERVVQAHDILPLWTFVSFVVNELPRRIYCVQ